MIFKVRQVALLPLIAALLMGCEPIEDVSNVAEARFTPAVQRIPGEVQVLNGCGVPGVAEKMRQYLVKHGFDVVESDNAPDWNYQKTLVAIRTPRWEGERKLARTLRTDQVVVLLNERTHADATIFVGTDYQEIFADGPLDSPL